MKKFLATAATAALLATGGVAVAGAADSGSPTTTAKPPAATGEQRAGARFAHRRVAVRVLAITAKAIGVERADLVAQLRAGKTVAQVAETHGVDAATVEHALNAAFAKRVDAALASGRIDEARATQMKERASARVKTFVEETPKRVAKTTRRGAAANALRVAAKTIGVAPRDLLAELRAGKSVAAVAQAHGVDRQTVVDAIVKAATPKLEHRAEQFVDRTRG
jgi:uncharacterized protein (DUF433 family)